MPSGSRAALGRAGEDLALTELERQGCRLLDRNWRCPLGEIDLVVLLGDQLVFVEVRTRRGASPAESVGPAKAARLIALARTYLEARAEPADRAWRIDVVGVGLDRAGRLIALEHIPYAIEER